MEKGKRAKDRVLEGRGHTFKRGRSNSDSNTLWGGRWGLGVGGGTPASSLLQGLPELSRLCYLTGGPVWLLTSPPSHPQDHSYESLILG